MARSISPVRQGRPNVSVTTTATSTPASSSSRDRSAPGRGVRVDGQQQHACPARCWSRRPRRPPAPARAGSRRSGSARGAPPPGRSRRRWPPRGRPARTRPSALDTIFEVTTTHVAVGQREVLAGQRGDQHGREVVARGDLGDAVRRPDQQRPAHPRSPRRRARRRAPGRSGPSPAAASTSGISSGTARQAIPAASTVATASASLVSTSQPSSSPPSARSRSAAPRPRRWSRRRWRRAPCRPCRAPARRRRSARARRPAPADSTSASRMPGTARTVPMLTTGLDGGSSTTSAVGDRLEHAGAGLRVGRRRPARSRARRALRAAAPSTPGSARPSGGPRPRRLRVVDHDVGLDPVVAHRQQPHAGRQAPAGAQRLGDLAQRVARVEHLGPDDVGGEVAVAEAEPGRPHAVRRQLVLDHEGLVGAAPALLLVDAAAEGVHHGVEVGADPQPEQRDVVAGVADDGDVEGLVGAWRHRGEQAAQEPGPADAAGRDDDVHGAQSGLSSATRRKRVLRSAKYHRLA